MVSNWVSLSEINPTAVTTDRAAVRINDTDNTPYSVPLWKIKTLTRDLHFCFLSKNTRLQSAKYFEFEGLFSSLKKLHNWSTKNSFQIRHVSTNPFTFCIMIKANSHPLVQLDVTAVSRKPLKRMWLFQRFCCSSSLAPSLGLVVLMRDYFNCCRAIRQHLLCEHRCSCCNLSLQVNATIWPNECTRSVCKFHTLIATVFKLRCRSYSLAGIFPRLLGLTKGVF